nr:hypothetical protein [Candidatus Neomarinimicrobiota bacterium]
TYWFDTGIKFSEGAWEQGEMNGLWLWYNPDGSVVEEKTYHMGKLNGRSTKWLTTETKDWEHFYKNGMLDGPTTIWENNYRARMTTYKADAPEGPWVIWYANSEQIKEHGFHQKGMRDGLTTHYYENGEKMKEGYLKLGKPDGVWTYWNTKGKEDFNFDYGTDLEHVGWSRLKTVEDLYFKIDDDIPFTGVIADENEDEGYLFLGRTLNGKKDGPWIRWYMGKDLPEVVLVDVPDPEPDLPWSGGKEEQGAWKNGKKHGFWTFWYDNQQIKSQGTYENGIMNGQWIFYYENGAKEKDGTLLDGNADGEWTFYDEMTNKIQEGTFSLGVKEGKWTAYFSDGRVTEGHYKNGKKDADWTSWWNTERTRKEMQGTYRNGKMVDKWYFYNNKGNLKEIRYFSPVF